MDMFLTSQSSYDQTFFLNAGLVFLLHLFNYFALTVCERDTVVWDTFEETELCDSFLVSF